jgi:hypothetical protein
MDGVLSDFERRYLEIFGTDPALVRKNKEFSKNWSHFVENEHFASLDYHPGAVALLEVISNLPNHIEVEILSSSGGEKYHELVQQQKLSWLNAHGISVKANVVSSRGLKKTFASPDAILIDDHVDNIKQFRDAGGIGIHHTNVGDTLSELDKYLGYVG